MIKQFDAFKHDSQLRVWTLRFQIMEILSIFLFVMHLNHVKENGCTIWGLSSENFLPRF